MTPKRLRWNPLLSGKSRQIAANRIPLPLITPELLTGELGKKNRAECLPTQVKKANIWCHGIKAIIPDCLSGDRGSIPRSIAISPYLPNS